MEHFGGIALSGRGNAATSSFNEQLTVEVGDQALFLKIRGVSLDSKEGTNLIFEEAAELYWRVLVEQLQ
ncbi:MAG: hypothetical protein KUG74_10770 [Rhodobacteraceae bacterium]|nr:hypothetical protein [Paracoccaceae bacterium]